MSEEKKYQHVHCPSLLNWIQQSFGAALRIKSFGIKSVPIAEPSCGILAPIAPAV